MVNVSRTGSARGERRAAVAVAAGLGPAMADDSLSAAVAAVTGAWIADGMLAAQTLDKFGLLIRRFARFAAAHDVTTLAGADRGLVAKFVAAKGRTRHGVVSQAAVATMHNRRAALRLLPHRPPAAAHPRRSHHRHRRPGPRIVGPAPARR